MATILVAFFVTSKLASQFGRLPKARECDRRESLPLDYRVLPTSNSNGTNLVYLAIIRSTVAMAAPVKSCDLFASGRIPSTCSDNCENENIVIANIMLVYGNKLGMPKGAHTGRVQVGMFHLIFGNNCSICLCEQEIYETEIFTV